MLGDDLPLPSIEAGIAWIIQDPMDMIILVIGEGQRGGEDVTVAGMLDNKLVLVRQGAHLGGLI